jgi:hypothetical protein
MRVNMSNSGAFSCHQRANDFVHIAAGAKVVACAVDHHHIDVVGPLERVKQVAHFGIRVESERVFALGPVEREGGHAVLHLPQKVLGHVPGQGRRLPAIKAGSTPCA